jgi:DNA-directed RNA polymerase subunit RPC12/RpoP
MSEQEIKEAIYCPMCGSKNGAELNQPNGGWTDIDCDDCGGGTFYLWARSEKPCTASLKILHK